MFSRLFDSLHSGKAPGKGQLDGLLRMAVTKKMGVLRMPYHCRPGDPKINPSAKHLLWAAIVAGDGETVVTVVQLIALELLEKKGGGRQSGIAGELSRQCDRYCRELEELVDRHTDLAGVVGEGCRKARRAAGGRCPDQGEEGGEATG